MAKKEEVKERFKPSDHDRSALMKKFLTRREDGSYLIDDIIPNNGICPSCTSGKSFEWDKDANGKRTKRFVIPWRVDRQNLHFWCKECGFQGSPVNFIMQMRKMVREEAFKYLERL